MSALRAWRTPAGETIVEGPPAAGAVNGYPILTGAGDPVEGAHVYYRIDATGTLHRLYDDRSFASEDDLYGTTHQVVGTALVSYHSTIRAVPWAVGPDGVIPRTDREQVEVAGLVPVSPEEALGADPAGAVAAALAAYRREEWERAERLRRPAVEARASFAAALDILDGPADLVFAYDGGAVVRDAAGAVVWRPEQQPAMRGKDLHSILSGVLRDRSGGPVPLRVDLAGAPWWFWAPDE